MKEQLTLCAALLFAATSWSATPSVDALLGRMTLEEKVGQLVQAMSGVESHLLESTDATNQKIPDALVQRVRRGEIGALIGACGMANFNAIQRVAVEESRLGIPLMVGHDMIHGAMTQCPVPLALSCMWDEALWEECGLLIARETPLKGCNWTFAPMCDIARDPRWGRIVEGPGQDPFLGAKMSAALVRGIQSGVGGVPIAACLKHYVAYGAVEGGRDYDAVELGDTTLRNVYLPPFAAGVRAGALTVMPSFNTLNGLPMSMNPRMLRDILRGELGFNGFTISDWEAILECSVNGHGMAADLSGLARRAIDAGMDMDMLSKAYEKHLADLVRSGKVSVKTLDESVRNVLRVKMALGLFTNPYIDEAKAKAKVDFAADAALARKAAAKSFVLLKNNGVLPLAKGLKVALVGPGMENVTNLCGCWSTYRENLRTCRVTEGFAEAGIPFAHSETYDFKGGDVIVAAFGEPHDYSGEGQSRVDIGLPAAQRKALDDLKATGKPLVALVFGGRPRAIPELAEKADAILVVWNGGSCMGGAIADVLTGMSAPEGRLTTSFPHSAGAVPLYYNHLPTGRPAPKALAPWTACYQDEPWWALYPFGYGLTYTRFDYTNESVRVEGNRVILAADVKNVGTRAGVETVQAYTRQMAGVVSRPVRELRGWQKIALKPGASKRVEIAVPLDDLAYWAGNERIPASGEMRAWIAPDSASGRLLTFTLP